jgi:hypothetical protein
MPGARCARSLACEVESTQANPHGKSIIPPIQYGWRRRLELPVGDRPASTCVVDRKLLPAVLGAGSLANRENGIAGIFFISAVLLGGAAPLFRNAAGEISVGTGWASDVCSTSQMFCHPPKYPAYAAGAVPVIAIGIKLSSAAS